jgi:hypothetical protein
MLGCNIILYAFQSQRQTQKESTLKIQARPSTGQPQPGLPWQNGNWFEVQDNRVIQGAVCKL